MRVKFLPQDIELEIKPNQSVKDLADKNGIFIKSICNGLPSCAECRIRIVEGEHNILPPATKELNLIGTGHFIDQRRLSCQVICFGDITVDLSEQVEKQKNMGAQRPQGSRKTEMDVSHAITGNLIDEIKKDEIKPPQKNSDNRGSSHDNRGNSHDTRGSSQKKTEIQGSQKKPEVHGSQKK